MANAALVHLYNPPHPSLANRCEILDMAWIWHPGGGGGGGVWLDFEGEQFPPPTASFVLLTFFFWLFSCKQTAFWDCPQPIIDIICYIFKLENNRCSCFLEISSLVTDATVFCSSWNIVVPIPLLSHTDSDTWTFLIGWYRVLIRYQCIKNIFLLLLLLLLKSCRCHKLFMDIDYLSSKKSVKLTCWTGVGFY